MDPYAAFYTPPSPPESILEHIERVRSILRPAYDRFGNRIYYNLQDELAHGIYLVESLPSIRPWDDIRELLLDNYDIQMARVARIPNMELRFEQLPFWIGFNQTIQFLIQREAMLCPFDYIRYP